MKKNQNGFTLIEIAIVLVIIGLLLGGVLKGQELITSARVRNLISQQDGFKAAYFAFQDRYRALPGDYAQATTNIIGATQNGNGNGQIEGGATLNESILAWEHLSRAGFINGSYTYAATANDASAPKNPYSSYLQLAYDNSYGAGTQTVRHNLKTGSQIPVNILAEVDLKIDDGDPLGGAFQFSAYSAGTAPAAANCYNTAVAPARPTWKITGNEPNCGGTSIF